MTGERGRLLTDDELADLDRWVRESRSTFDRYWMGQLLAHARLLDEWVVLLKADVARLEGWLSSAHDEHTALGARAQELVIELAKRRALDERVAALERLETIVRQQREYEGAPTVIETLHWAADRVRAHSGYDPGKALDDIADELADTLVALDAAREEAGDA